VHRAVGVVAVMLGSTLALLLPACAKKEEAGTSAGSAAGSAAPAPVTSVDDMLKRSFAELGGEYFAATIEIEYVRPDGTLDPTYGNLVVEAGKHPPPKPPKPADDPNRPVGAPEPVDEDHHRDLVAMAMARCPNIRWRDGQMVVRRDGSCAMFLRQKLTMPRCTVLGILARARDRGAPPNALAKISFDVGFGEDAVQTWRITIDDNPRDIHFKLEGNDDCEPIVEKP